MIFNTEAIREEYFKYNYKDWTQPVLTSNGTVGGESFAVRAKESIGAAYDAYKAFDGVDSEWGAHFTKNSGWLDFYNSKPLKVTQLELSNFGGDSWGVRSLIDGSVWGSDNGNDFTKLIDYHNTKTGGGAHWFIDLSNIKKAYKYFRITCTNTSYANGGAASQCFIRELKITAQEYVNTIPGTPTDYDIKKSNNGIIKDIYINKNFLNFFSYENILVFSKASPITFLPSSTFQEYIVPAGIKHLGIDCVASQGWTEGTKSHGGLGGRVQCLLSVTPNQKLYLMIGERQNAFNDARYNASDIRTDNSGITTEASLRSRLIVAGAGGAVGNVHYLRDYNKNGGDGGGLVGGTGVGDSTVGGIGGVGGSQSAGGKGAYYSMYLKSQYAKDGTFGLGGEPSSHNSTGGYGGSGWYGGGGAVEGSYYAGSSEYGASCAGAGGGSSYTDPNLCSKVIHTQGFKEGNGYIKITPLP